MSNPQGICQRCGGQIAGAGEIYPMNALFCQCDCEPLLPTAPLEIGPIEVVELRLFRAVDKFELKGRGTVWIGPCPFEWDKEKSLTAWHGEWLISHPDADHTKTYKVIGVESFLTRIVREGSMVGILVREYT